MTANLDTTLGFVALAFTGPRSKIWHKTGNSIDEKAKELGRPLTVAEIFALGGVDFTVRKVPLEFVNPADPNGAFAAYPDRFANVRIDTGAALGIVSDRYQNVQPQQIRDEFANLISADERFQMTTVGSLDQGRRIFAQAVFNGEQTVAGDRHRAKLLMSTSFDTASRTRYRGCFERVVCENTIEVALGEYAPEVAISHGTKFDAEKARKQLGKIAQGFANFKVMGDALAQRTMTADELSNFLRDVLDIPRDAKKEDVSTRKQNQRQAIIDAMLVSANERGLDSYSKIDAFTALQGITRYVDHDRDDGDTDARLFGSGNSLKLKAQSLLLPFVFDDIKSQLVAV